jgi:hypothetical protein
MLQLGAQGLKMECQEGWNRSEIRANRGGAGVATRVSGGRAGPPRPSAENGHRSAPRGDGETPWTSALLDEPRDPLIPPIAK